MEMKGEIEKRRKEKWYEFIFSVEVLAIERDTAESSLKEHIAKMENAPGIFIYEKKLYETQQVKNPMKDVELAYSQAVTLKLFIKDLYTALTAIMIFGPSAVEALGPDKKDISVGEVQNIANNVASLVHQFAAAGIGGLVVMPQPKPRKE